MTAVERVKKKNVTVISITTEKTWARLWNTDQRDTITFVETEDV